MIWLAAGFLLSPVFAKELPPPPNVIEIEAHNCARAMAGMLFPLDQSGPMFAEGGLAFTSVNANNGALVLIVSSGSGIYGIPMSKTGVNRMRFRLPSGAEDGGKTYFLSYLHGDKVRSRVFEFSAGAPPPGRDELDYSVGVPFRAQNMLPHFEYAIHATVSRLVGAVTDGKVLANHIRWQNSQECKYLDLRGPALARAIKQELGELHMMTTGLRVGGSRLPASKHD